MLKESTEIAEQNTGISKQQFRKKGKNGIFNRELNLRNIEFRDELSWFMSHEIWKTQEPKHCYKQTFFLKEFLAKEWTKARNIIQIVLRIKQNVCVWMDIVSKKLYHHGSVKKICFWPKKLYRWWIFRVALCGMAALGAMKRALWSFYEIGEWFCFQTIRRKKRRHWFSVWNKAVDIKSRTGTGRKRKNPGEILYER